MQSDFDITTADANTGATMRTQINAALQALATNSAAATEPGTKYPFMWWPDTATDTLKQRNAANTAWVNVLKLSTGVAFSAATSAACTGNAATATDATNATNATDSTNAVNATGAGTIPIARYENGLRIVRGTVRGSDGAILAGAGFTVAHPATGLFNITFTNAFSAQQSVLPVLDNKQGSFSYAGSPNIRSSISTLGYNQISIMDGTTPKDWDFSFIAIGLN